jgi:hypothetical protein
MALVAGGYATHAIWAWLRYGHASAPASGEEQDALLDQFMPIYEIVERHHIRVDAPAAITFAAAKEMDLRRSPIVRTVFRAREWLMRGRPGDNRKSGSFVEQMIGIGWAVLAELSDREIVMGAATKPWLADVTFRPLARDDFATFHEPGYVKIVWSLRADPEGDRASIFRTETRAVATDSSARAKFRRYWALASPGIILIRWATLGPLKREAEQRAR